MLKNVASQKIALFCFDVTTGLAKVGDAANLTAYVSKDYGAVTVLADTSAAEMDSTNAKGWYLFDVAQAETNADACLFTGKSSTANISVVGQLIFTTTELVAALAAADDAVLAAVAAGVTLTSAERNSVADALLDRANGIETGLTVRQAQRLIAAASAGKLSGAATATVVIRNAVADSKDRITATTDADGNRTAVTADLS